MSVQFIGYPKCSTCRKARKWLVDNGVAFEERDITSDNPSSSELRTWHVASGLPIRRFFNTSGKLYREMELKDKRADMSDEDCYDLLASDGMLVKRPVVVDGERVLVGFREAEWAEALL